MPTQLDLSAKALARVRAPRAIYCCVCCVGHIVEPGQLWLGSDAAGVHPLAATPWARWLGGEGSAHATATGQTPGLDVSGEPILSRPTSTRGGKVARLVSPCAGEEH